MHGWLQMRNWLEKNRPWLSARGDTKPELGCFGYTLQNVLTGPHGQLILAMLESFYTWLQWKLFVLLWNLVFCGRAVDGN